MSSTGFLTGLPWIWISMDISMDGFVISMDIVDIHGHRGFPWTIGYSIIGMLL